MPEISVIMGVYNELNKDILMEAVNSILHQTFEDFEFIIYDDGSCPEAATLLREVEGLDERIKLIGQDENHGLAFSLNACIDEAKGKYIARMDADDISVPNRLANQVNYLLLHPEVDVVGGRIEEINEQSERNGKSVTYPLTHQECFKFFRYRDPLAHPAVMFRKSFFDKAKGYRNEYRKNQDTMLWFDGFMNGCIFANLDETVLLFRVTDDFYKNRRNGFKRAKKMLKDRFMINKALHYDWSAYLFSFLMFIMTLTPPFLKKFLYRIR